MQNLNWESYYGSANIADANEIESFLNIKFPESYKSLVKDYNGAFVGGAVFDFFSNFIGENVTRGLGIFLGYGEVNELEESMQFMLDNPPESFPENLVMFSGLANGDYLCFDFGKLSKQNEPRIVVWHHEGTPGTKEEISEVAKSFDSFLANLYIVEDED